MTGYYHDGDDLMAICTCSVPALMPSRTWIYWEREDICCCGFYCRVHRSDCMSTGVFDCFVLAASWIPLLTLLPGSLLPLGCAIWVIFASVLGGFLDLNRGVCLGPGSKAKEYLYISLSSHFNGILFTHQTVLPSRNIHMGLIIWTKC